MGCDYTLIVQVRQGSGPWRVSFWGETKSSCGGGLPGYVLSKLVATSDATTRYGCEEQRVILQDGTLLKVCYHHYPGHPPSGHSGQRAPASEAQNGAQQCATGQDEGQAEQGEASDEEEEEASGRKRRELRHSAHLSLKDLAGYIRVLEEELANATPMPAHRGLLRLLLGVDGARTRWSGSERYVPIIKRILALAEVAALSSPGPQPETPWWQGDETEESLGLPAGRAERLRVHRGYLAAHFRRRLSPETIAVIAEYSVPEFDVRLSIYDDEHNASKLWDLVKQGRRSAALQW